MRRGAVVIWVIGRTILGGGANAMKIALVSTTEDMLSSEIARDEAARRLAANNPCVRHT